MSTETEVEYLVTAFLASGVYVGPATLNAEDTHEKQVKARGMFGLMPERRVGTLTLQVDTVTHLIPWSAVVNLAATPVRAW